MPSAVPNHFSGPTIPALGMLEGHIQALTSPNCPSKGFSVNWVWHGVRDPPGNSTLLLVWSLTAGCVHTCLSHGQVRR